MPGGRRGAALLEALAALTIATIALSASLNALIYAAHEQAALSEREEQSSRAGKLLTVYSLLTRDELDQRLGQQLVNSWVMRVQRPEKDLYRIAIATSVSPDHELMVTVLYRPARP